MLVKLSLKSGSSGLFILKINKNINHLNIKILNNINISSEEHGYICWAIIGNNIIYIFYKNDKEYRYLLLYLIYFN